MVQGLWGGVLGLGVRGFGFTTRLPVQPLTNQLKQFQF